MIKLSLDEETLRKFREVQERVEVTDLEGRVVGFFEPNADFYKSPEPTEEELAESERDPVTYSLDEVWEKIHRGEKM